MRSYIAVSRILSAALLALALGAALPGRVLAAPAGPAWEISSVAQPSNFSIEDNAKCTSSSYPICDRYLVTLTNVGEAQTNGALPVTVTDILPPGLEVVRVNRANLETNLFKEGGEGWSCNLGSIATCTYTEAVKANATLALAFEVEVTSPVGEVTNVVEVSGGGAPRVSTSEPLTMPNTIGGAPSTFGISAFGFAAHDALGQVDTQAGDHPYGVTATVNLNSTIETRASGSRVFASVEPPKDLVVYLPLGFIGDPTAADRCTETQLIGTGAETETECPPTSRVGSAVRFSESDLASSVGPEGNGISAVYNMVPDGDFPAQFGLKVLGKPVPLYASVVHTSQGYALRVAVTGVPRSINVEGAALTLYGDPNAADGNANSSKAFFTNPDDCSAGPLTARVQADSWAAPGVWSPPAEERVVAYPGLSGCNLLQFEPTVEMQPEVTQAEEPTGYEIKIKVPQSPEQFPVLATPQLKDVTMTLPAGMTVAAGGAVGLGDCEATGPHGIDMPTGGGTPTEVGEGEAIGPDGMSHLVPGHCPPSSQIGTVKITTPVLTKSLTGHLYVAQPQCGGPGQSPCTAADATNGRLFGLYLEAAGSGVVVKLAGSASVDPATGRITARFLENPQLPVSEVALDIEGGDRSPLANPRQCGQAVTSGDLTPWSAPVTPDAIVGAEFSVDWDGNGGACPATLPFAPGFTAGVTNTLAGHFSPFTLTLTRGDRQQDLSRLQVKLPLGLLGMLSKVPLCAEPQAARGECGQASWIGTTAVAAGPGSQPLVVRGNVYLTGPYEGAPFGLSVVVPAVAGPFNLGNVVVRARIDADPNTAAITVTSDPLPQFLDGVPLRLQTLSVDVEREGFTFNPTSCTARQVTATVAAEQGAAANLSVPFAVEGCRSLPFKPTFSATVAARASKALGASLDVKVGSSAGQANIAKAVVSLPKQLPARLTTLQQACPEATFAANPATCPIGSDVGSATVVTPILSAPLTGPAYLVSHGGAAFPDLVVILQGQGVRLDLTGNTSIKKGITTSSFATIPDAPITSFELKLPEGGHSALSANISPTLKGNLCTTKLTMPTTLSGQNGIVLKQNTKISISGCPKVKKAKKARKASHGSSRRQARRR